MDFERALRSITSGLLDVTKDTNVLAPYETPTKKQQLRLRESTYILTEKTKRFSNVVSAHQIDQYRNPFYSIHLREGVQCWLDVLLNIDKAEV